MDDDLLKNMHVVTLDKLKSIAERATLSSLHNKYSWCLTDKHSFHQF